MTRKKVPFGLDEWLVELSRMDAVAMGAVIRELNKLTESEESSVQQLSEQILKDPSLTSKILKAANTVFYNPSKSTITTVSRAIMNVGFTTVRAICVSAIVIEVLLKDHPRECLIRQMARSFHAAIQARDLCDKARADVKEEVFVAALLLHLGELLVWSFPHGNVDKVYQLYQQGATPRELEAVLGVTFERLTVEMADQWHLGETLKEALSNSEELSRMSEAVRLGDEIAIAMESGWESPKMKAVLKKVGVFTNQPEAILKRRIRQSTDEATQLSKVYGDAKLTQLISATKHLAEHSSPSNTMLQPNPQAQLQSLQAIMQLMGGKMDTSKLFELVMQGMHEGVGLERCVLAIFNQSRSQISAKYVSGPNSDRWRESFQFDYERSAQNLFAAVVGKREAVWVGHADFNSISRLRTESIDRVVGIGDFLIGPILAANREVGFLYADMRISGRALNDAYFTGFKHFLQQTSLCLGLLANKS